MKRNAIASMAAIVAMAAPATGHGQAPVAAAAVTPPQVLEHADPDHPGPPHLETTVVLRVDVEKDGTVGGVEVAESGGEAFDRAAIQAVRRWRFVAATRGGAPVASRIRVPFHFAPGPHTHGPLPAAAGERPRNDAPTDELREEFPDGVNAPHAVAVPGRPIEIHVIGRPHAPRRGTSDFRLDRRTLAAAPHATAADLLSTAPGVHVTHPEGDAVAQRITLRGFDAEHGQDIELRVGSVPLNQRSHIHGQGYADLNVVIPETVRSIRVVEGVYDPEQGDFAVAGSAYFDLGVEERGLHVTSAAGSFGTWRETVVWAPDGEADDTFVAATVRTSEGFGDGTRGSTSGGATGQYRFQLAGDTSALLHLAGHGARANIAGVVRRDDVTAGRVDFHGAYPDATARSQSAGSSRAQLALTVDHARDDGTHLEASLWAALTTFRSRLNFTGYTQRSRERPEWVGRGDLIEQSNQDVGFGGRTTYRGRKHEIVDWLTTQFSLGADVQTDTVDQAQNLVQAPQNETWDHRVDASLQATDVGVFGDALLAITSYARLRAGLRADLLVFDVDDRLGNFTPAFQEQTHFPGFRRTAAGVAWGPRIALEGDPAPWLRLSAAYGEGYRSPQARRLEEGESAPFADVQSYEIGGRLHDRDRASLTLAVYETRLSYDLAFDAAEGRLERIGPTTRRGLVAYLEARPTDRFLAAVSGTFVHATLDAPPPATPENPTPPFAEGQRLPFVPPLVLRTDMGWAHPVASIAGEILELRLGAGTTFLSPRPLPYDQEAQPVFLVDASAALRRSWLEVGVEAQNLLDATYAENEYSFVSDWQTRSIPSALPARHVAAGPPLGVLGHVTVHLEAP